MKSALVVNCSAPHYNLGAAKLANWLRAHEWTVTEVAGDPGLFALGYDLVALSVIFSWHAPIARDIALRVKPHSEVWCGGPGMFALLRWWERETGLRAHKGLDRRFDRQPGQYKLTFASRGCPVGCYFCIVPRLEGTAFTLNWAFQPAPVLCDNNLSALPVEFQKHIIARYQETGVVLGDANSGFEPRTFTEHTYRRWRRVLRGPWRFALDDQGDLPHVERMMRILQGEPAKRKRVYVLVGNEPLAACYDRAMQVIAWGGEPFCQFVLPLNWLGDPATLRPRFDWTVQRGKDFCRYFNRYIWRYASLTEYQARKHEDPPFAGLVPGRVLAEVA